MLLLFIADVKHQLRDTSGDHGREEREKIPRKEKKVQKKRTTSNVGIDLLPLKMLEMTMH